MTVEEAIVRFLRAATLPHSGARVYQDFAPPGTAYPYVAVALVDAHGEHHQGGAAGLVEARVQVDVWGPDKTQVAADAERVRVLMDGKPRGTLGAGADAIEIEGVHLEGRYLHYHDPVDAGQVGHFQAICDFLIWHRESAAVL